MAYLHNSDICRFRIIRANFTTALGEPDDYNIRRKFLECSCDQFWPNVLLSYRCRVTGQMCVKVDQWTQTFSFEHTSRPNGAVIGLHSSLLKLGFKVCSNPNASPKQLKQWLIGLQSLLSDVTRQVKHCRHMVLTRRR